RAAMMLVRAIGRQPVAQLDKIVGWAKRAVRAFREGQNRLRALPTRRENGKRFCPPYGSHAGYDAVLHSPTASFRTAGTATEVRSRRSVRQNAEPPLRRKKSSGVTTTL